MALARTLLRSHSLSAQPRYLTDALESAKVRRLMRSGSLGALAPLGAVRQANEYLMAVGGARESDSEVMYNALRTAIAKDAKWKQRAAMDIEFYEFFEDDLFKEITQ